MADRHARIPADEAHGSGPSPAITRVAAISVDGVLVIPTQIVGFIIAGNLILTGDDPDATAGIGTILGGLVVLVAALVPTIYTTLAHASPWQATVGKRAMRMAVVEAETGASLTLGRSFVRAVLFVTTVYAGGAIGAIGALLLGNTPTALFVMILLAIAGLFLVPAIARPDGRCFHDLMAGTRVIHDPRRR